MNHTDIAMLAASLALSLPACSGIQQTHDPQFPPEQIRHYGMGFRFGMHYELIAHDNGTSHIIGAVVPQPGLREIIVYHPGTAIVSEKPTDVPSVPVSIARVGLIYHSEELELGHMKGPWGDLKETSMEIPQPVLEFILSYQER